MTEELVFDFWYGQEMLWIIQTNCGAHSACYPVGSRHFVGIEWLRYEANCLSPTMAEVKNVCMCGSVPPLPHGFVV